MISADKMKCEKMKLHMIYICVIAIACAVLTIILSFCDNTMFKNCISVSSTVTSIILSVIAIILSVTGERTTNEIRNKVSDSVQQLEKCTNDSSALAEELTGALQQLNELYKNINEKIVDQFPNFNEILESNSKLGEDNGESDKAHIQKNIISITNFINHLPVRTKWCAKKALMFIMPEKKGVGKLFTTNDILRHLLNEGADSQLAALVTGMVIGYVSSGICNYDSLDEIVEKIVIE